MSPDPAQVLAQANAFRDLARVSVERGTRGNPAYLPADATLVEKLIQQAYDDWHERELPAAEMARFIAENILGLHIDNPPGKEPQ